MDHDWDWLALKGDSVCDLALFVRILTGYLEREAPMTGIRWSMVLASAGRYFNNDNERATNFLAAAMFGTT